MRRRLRQCLLALLSLAGLSLLDPAGAAELPPARDGDWVMHDFRFHDGSVLPELRLHYTTLGDPHDDAVLVLHGTLGAGSTLLSPEFGGVLFGPGGALDARHHFLILPDGIGSGRSSKPSDGLRAAFPAYDYDDMVEAQYRLVAEHLGIRHLRVVLGYSMGGMQTWLWGERHPGFMDGLVPLAAQATAMSGRNWMLRRMVIDAVREDPAWQGGNYQTQPQAFRVAHAFFLIATSAGAENLQRLAPTRAKADAYVDQQLAQLTRVDANDYLYQWSASGDYDAEPGIDRIQAPVLAINAADDPRNPPELGTMERVLRRLPAARYQLLPGGPDTHGHGTVLNATAWSDALAEFLNTLPRR